MHCTLKSTVWPQSNNFGVNAITIDVITHSASMRDIGFTDRKISVGHARRVAASPSRRRGSIVLCISRCPAASVIIIIVFGSTLDTWHNTFANTASRTCVVRVKSKQIFCIELGNGM